MKYMVEVCSVRPVAVTVVVVVLFVQFLISVAPAVVPMEYSYFWMPETLKLSMPKSRAAGLVGGFSVLPPYVTHDEYAPAASLAFICQWYSVSVLRPLMVTVAVPPVATPVVEQPSPSPAGLLKAVAMGSTSAQIFIVSLPSESVTVAVSLIDVSFVQLPVDKTVSSVFFWAAEVGLLGAVLVAKVVISGTTSGVPMALPPDVTTLKQYEVLDGAEKSTSEKSHLPSAPEFMRDVDVKLFASS